MTAEIPAEVCSTVDVDLEVTVRRAMMCALRKDIAQDLRDHDETVNDELEERKQ